MCIIQAQRPECPYGRHRWKWVDLPWGRHYWICSRCGGVSFQHWSPGGHCLKHRLRQVEQTAPTTRNVIRTLEATDLDPLCWRFDDGNQDSA